MAAVTATGCGTDRLVMPSDRSSLPERSNPACQEMAQDMGSRASCRAGKWPVGAGKTPPAYIAPGRAVKLSALAMGQYIL